MNPIKTVEPSPLKPKSTVKGPIRCHKCQLLCVDAEGYLSHECQPRQSYA